MGKAHFLSTVISNLELVPDYYQRATLTYYVPRDDPLAGKLLRAGEWGIPGVSGATGRRWGLAGDRGATGRQCGLPGDSGGYRATVGATGRQRGLAGDNGCYRATMGATGRQLSGKQLYVVCRSTHQK